MFRLIRELLSAVILAAASFAFFILAYATKRQVSPSAIIFYEGIVIAALAATIFCVGYFIFAYNGASRLYVLRSSVFLLLGSFSLNYAFVITFPTLLDRSISVTLLSLVDQSPAGKISVESLNNNFIRVYVAGDAQIRKRVEEQVTTGNFRMEGGHVVITERGRLFASTFRLMAAVFNTPRANVDARPEK